MPGTSEGGKKAAETRGQSGQQSGKSSGNQQHSSSSSSNLTNADRIKGGQNSHSGGRSSEKDKE